MATYQHPISREDLETLQAQGTYAKRDIEHLASMRGAQLRGGCPNKRIYEFIFPSLQINPLQIHAVASGRIIEAKESDVAMFLESDIAHQTNLATLLCNDGTIIEHIHLTPSVEKGMKVNKGDEIGVLGRVLYTSRPHIHITFSKEGAKVKPAKFKVT